MSKIAIIGANGYIARNFIKYLQKNTNAEIFGYDIQDCQFDGLSQYKQIDLLDKKSISNIDFNTEICYMFSGKTGTLNAFENYEMFLNINELGLLNFLDGYVKAKSKSRIIFPSTRLVYKGKKDVFLAEDSEKEFKTLYAVNKNACENILYVYSNMYGIPYNIVRICVPYGTMIDEASSYGTLGAFIQQAKKGEITLYGGGQVKRTFTSIYDLCRALAVFTQYIPEKIVYNIGGGDHTSLFNLASKIAHIYKSKVTTVPFPENAFKIESGDTMLDSSRFDNEFAFSYTDSLDSWISKQI